MEIVLELLNDGSSSIADYNQTLLEEVEEIISGWIWGFSSFSTFYTIAILKRVTKISGTRSFDRITFFQNSFFSFESRSFKFFLFLTFFQIRVLSKLSPISKERYSDKLPLPVQNRSIDRIHSFEQPSYRA
jgi:hypothetical protein